MATKRTTKKSTAPKKFVKRVDFHFFSQEHLDLVQRARAHVHSTTMNSWIVQATNDLARKQLSGE